MTEEGAVRDRLHLHAGQRTHRGRDALDVRLVLGEDRDVAHLMRRLDAHQIDRPEQRALLPPRPPRTRTIPPSRAPPPPIAVATRPKAPASSAKRTRKIALNDAETCTTR